MASEHDDDEVRDNAECADWCLAATWDVTSMRACTACLKREKADKKSGWVSATVACMCAVC